MHEEKDLPLETFDLVDRICVGRLVGFRLWTSTFFLRFRLWFLLLQTNFIFPYKCTEFRIVILLAV